MSQVLRNKNLATRFQILVEIAANQPYIQQKEIARHIGVTSQAVSDYINKLENDGWISSDGRSRYRITKEGVNWVLKALRELQQYSATAERALTNINTWAAIAGKYLKQGETVGLVMKEGLLYATAFAQKGARGITTCTARKGEDVGITNIEGIVLLESGKITIMEVPDIQNGGAKNVDSNRLRKQVTSASLIGAIGVEAIVALQRINREPDYFYGVTQSAVEAARSGLSSSIVCTSSESPILQQKLTEENIAYRTIDMRKR